MAKINGSTSSANWTFKLEVDEVSTSVENNTSQVRVRGYLGRPSGNGGYGYAGNYNYTVKIDNNSSYTRTEYNKYQSEGAIAGGGWSSQALFDVTFTIPHNSDGTKTINVVGSMWTSEFSPSSASANGDVVLAQLHKPPEIGTATMVETNQTLISLGVPDTTIVANLSQKTITLNGTPYDSATLLYRIEHFNTDYVLPSLPDQYQSSNVFNTDYNNHYVSISNTGKAKIIQRISDTLGGLSSDWLRVNINNQLQEPNGIPYIKPFFERTSTNITRKSGNGVVLTDNKAVLNLVASIYKAYDIIGNNNSISEIGYKIWKATGETEPANYTPITTAIMNDGHITVENLEINNIEYTSVYNYKIILTDRYGKSASIDDGIVPTGLSVWTEYTNRVDFINATIKNNPIVDSGSNSNGNYIKYYDGTMICYKTVTDSVAMTTAWGNLYEGTMQLGDWPEEFISTPNVNVTNVSSTGAMIECFDIAPTATSAGTVYFARPISYTSNVTVNVLGIGKWK